MAAYKTIFEVKGKYPFPLDMLRYDNCHPVRGEDVSNIEFSIQNPYAGELTIRLCQISDVKGGRITAGRWASFGWEVQSWSEVHYSEKYPSR